MKSETLKVLDDYLKKIDEVIEKGQYKDDWSSLANHKVPDWYQKAKFGIFIHWGAYSIPSFFNEWYPKHMYEPESHVYKHHIEKYGTPKEFGYKEFIPMFKAEKFNPTEWADLFKEAGAKYVMPVAEHHDGFPMYDTDLSEWCTTKMGPHRDIIGELKEAFEKKDLVLTTSSHRIEHYWFMGGMREIESDIPEDLEHGHIYWPSNIPPFKGIGQWAVSGFDVDELFMQDWLARTCELIDKYKPKVLYFDWWIQVEPLKPYLRKFMAYYYNRALEWGEEVTINYKNDAIMYGCAVRDVERGQLADISPTFWQSCTSVAKNSWGYTEGNNYKESHELIQTLIDVVSKNGTLLLNIGPKPDGSIPEEDANLLKAVGAWLNVNGEGIYETTHWKKYGEGPTVSKEGHFTDGNSSEYTTEDFRYTYKNGFIYAFAMKWPEDGVVRMKLLGRKTEQMNAVIRSVEVLGAPNGCSHTLCNTHLTVIASGIDTKAPVCIKVAID